MVPDTLVSPDAGKLLTLAAQSWRQLSWNREYKTWPGCSLGWCCTPLSTPHTWACARLNTTSSGFALPLQVLLRQKEALRQHIPLVLILLIPFKVVILLLTRAPS